MKRQQLYKKMSQSIIQGEIEEAGRLAKKALEMQFDPIIVIEEGYVIGMEEVGRLFQTGEYFLPNLMAAAEAMKVTLRVLDPALKAHKAKRKMRGRVVLGTVEGDMHDIGKNIVGSMLVAANFEVIDLGVDVPGEKFLDVVKKVKPDILGLSCLLTTALLNQKNIVEDLEKTKELQDVKLMVGGAAVTNTWAIEIGADAYAENAVTAVTVAKRLVGPFL